MPGKIKDKQRKYPFFFGVYYGLVWRIPQLIVGGLRTAGSLGLQGCDAQRKIQFHNALTRQSLRYGFRFAIGLPVDPNTVRRIWTALPPEAQEYPVNWAKQEIGAFLGGSITSYLVARRLRIYFPKVLLGPSLFILSCQGALGFIWRDWWHGGPPPPPPPVGGGGGKLIKI